MDPVTAALNLLTEIIKGNNIVLQSASPDQRVAFANAALADLAAWRKFFQDIGLFPHTTP